MLPSLSDYWQCYLLPLEADWLPTYPSISIFSGLRKCFQFDFILKFSSFKSLVLSGTMFQLKCKFAWYHILADHALDFSSLEM